MASRGTVPRFRSRFIAEFSPSKRTLTRRVWTRCLRSIAGALSQYHWQVHDGLGAAEGLARVECGIMGVRTLRADDVAVLPVGTGHRLIDADDGQSLSRKRRFSAA
jgi:uncharacterized protein YjlB